jgi:hypothetical protein
MPTLSPEMDPIADDFFKKYTDAGLRCGVTIRHTHVARNLRRTEESGPRRQILWIEKIHRISPATS